MTAQFRTKKVDPFEFADIIMELQLACLPGDRPLDPTDYGGEWWIVFAARGEPVAFGAVKQLAERSVAYLSRAGVCPQWRGNRLQAKLIQVRCAWARRAGCKHVITDTALNNHASSNSLIRAGFKLYEPPTRWAFKDGLYWNKRL